MEQEKRIGRWRPHFFVLAAFHTAQELSRRQPASTAAGTETRRGRSKDSYADRSRRSDKTGRESRVHTNHRSSEERDTGSRPGDDKGRLLFFSTHPPKPRLQADRRFYPHFTTR